MFTRSLPLLLSLGLSFLVPLVFASARPMIQLIVPSYDYTPGRANSTIATGIANNRTIVGAYSSPRSYASYLRLANGDFGPEIIVPGAIFTTAFGINIAG
jgi:hypothetical protein